MSLDVLIAELRGMKSSGDPEGAHTRADEILIQALRDTFNPFYVGKDEIEELITAYQEVPRWYA